MVDVRPFRAIRYTQLAGNPEDLITQPYDKIDTFMQREYYARSPYNFCRVILPIEQNKYEAAKQRIEGWMNKNVLAKDKQEAFYICKQEFSLDEQACTRTGIIAALRLYDYEENVVYPHEITYSGPKIDRLRMLRTVKKDLEPVFLMYSDPERLTIDAFSKVSKTEPVVIVSDSFAVKHTVWRVTDPDEIRVLRQAFKSKTAVITDGHHRYESALAYRNEKRKEQGWSDDAASSFHMSLLVPLEDEGLEVLPAHRLLRRHELTEEELKALKNIFTIHEISPTVESLDKFLGTHKEEHAFAIYANGKAYGLVLKHDESVYEFVKAKSSKETKIFDVVILRDVIFKAILKTGVLEIDVDISYERSTRAAVDKVDRGEAKLAFLVNPISAETVWEIAHQHELMPEKTTDFYPKPASGLTVMDISDEERFDKD